jgi:hypothetical protein
MGNVFMSFIVPPINNADGLGLAMLTGFFVCVFSFITAIALISVDKYADKVDGYDPTTISEEEKFKFKDILTFKVKFWLICGSCVLTYGAVFPFMGFITKMLEDKYCID